MSTTAPVRAPDPALGGLDEDLSYLRAVCADRRRPVSERREAAMYARGLRRAVYVLAGRAL